MSPLTDGSWSMQDGIIFLILLMVFLHVYATWNFDYWKKRGVPHVKPIPVFGNMMKPLLMRASLGVLYQQLYWKLDGHPYGGYFKFREPALMIRDPELIRSVIVKNFDSFLNNDFNVDIMVDPLFGRNPVVIKDQAWKVIRPQLSPGFTAGKMKSLFPQLMEVCQEMKSYLECCGPSGAIDTKELCTKFSINAVASCAYGINGHTFEDPEAEFRKVGRKFLQPSFLKIVQQLFLLQAPKIASLLHFKVASLEVTEFFRKMTADATSYRRKETLRKNDFLDLLIQLKEKHEDQNKLENNRWFEKFTEEDIAAQALTFFTDGFETSSNALTMTLYEVAMNPGVQQRVRREVKEMLDRHGGGFTYEGLLELNYLDKVFAESLRKHPPVMFLRRQCTKLFELKNDAGKAFQIEPKTSIIIPTYAIHNDPKYYSDPEIFDPERFSEENIQNRPKYTYLPFGEGPRICLGMKFGQLLNKCAVAFLVTHFDLNTTLKTPKSLSPNPKAFVFSPLEDIWLEYLQIPPIIE